jgi:hypothetical protein
MWRDFFDFEDYSAPELAISGLEKSASEFLGFGSEFWAAVAGAVVGGVISGVISILLQRQNLKETRSQREGDRLEEKNALAYSLIFKVSMILNNQYRIWEGLHEVATYIEAHNMEAWQRFLPVANIPEKIELSSDELGFLLSLRDDAVFNSVLGIDRIHNSTIDVIRTLSASKTTLNELMPAPQMVEGQIGTGVISQEVFMALRPKMIDINILFEAEYSTLRQRYVTSLATLKNMVGLLQKKIGLKYEIRADIPVPQAPVH